MAGVPAQNQNINDFLKFKTIPGKTDRRLPVVAQLELYRVPTKEVVEFRFTSGRVVNVSSSCGTCGTK